LTTAAIGQSNITIDRNLVGWKIAKLRRFIREPLKYGANECALENNPNYPRYIRITDFDSDGNLNPHTFKSLPFEVAKPYLLADGDILLARSGATVGKSFLFHSNQGPACFAGYLIRARFQTDKVLPGFAFYYFKTSLYWNQVRQGSIQATIENVSAEKYSELAIVVPPLREQRKIILLLEQETSKIDALIEDKERLLKLLNERQQALITEVVT
jgi:type I restriction enzyme S subunit